MVKDLINISSKQEFKNRVRDILTENAIAIKKKLSQTFLVDPHELKLIAKIVKKESVDKPCIMEIGSGIGNLTVFLAFENIDKTIISVEYDQRFAKILKELQEDFYNVDVVIGDARQIIASVRGCNVVVGNLPYHITSQLLLSIAKGVFDTVIVTVQKEVAGRIASRPGTRGYGKLTAFLQHMFSVNYIKTIPLNKFYPRPEVHSAVLLLKRKHYYDSFSEVFEDIVKCLFFYRRKVVAKALSRCIDKEIDEKIEGLEEIWRKRVYQLSVEELEKIAHIFAKLKR
ncbi:MAG: 16S rRNA (adenine(1518)-N(6)/adenine(1519)-N(6))-dimethyltransferase RsmA [Ignisphaera sp.]